MNKALLDKWLAAIAVGSGILNVQQAVQGEQLKDEELATALLGARLREWSLVQALIVDGLHLDGSCEKSVSALVHLTHNAGRIVVSGCRLTNAGLDAVLDMLSAQGRAGRIEGLVLRGCELDTDAIASLCARREVWSRMEELVLSNNALGNAGIQLLCTHAAYFPSLRHLGIEDCGVSKDCLGSINKALKTSPWSRSMRSIAMDGNKEILSPLEVVPPLTTDEVARRGAVHAVLKSGRDWCDVSCVLVLGESAVGKTTLTRRLFGNDVLYYDRQLGRTEAFNLLERSLSRTTDGGRRMRIQAIDFGGEVNLHSAHLLFARRARCAVLIVCDATRTREGNRLDYWIRYVHHNCAKDCPIVVWVTKQDDLAARGEWRGASLERLAIELKEEHSLSGTRFFEVVDGMGWSPDGSVDAHVFEATCRLGMGVIERAIDAATSFWDVHRQEAIRVVESLHGELRATHSPGAVPFLRRERVAGMLAPWRGVEGMGVRDVVKLAHEVGAVVYAGSSIPVRAGDPLADNLYSPSWLRYPIYRLMNGANYSRSPGRLQWEDIEAILPTHEPDPHGSNEWECLEFDERLRAQVVDFMLAMGLIFSGGGRKGPIRYLVPDHLSRRVGEPPKFETTWERWYEWVSRTEFGRVMAVLDAHAGRSTVALFYDEIVVGVDGGGQLSVVLQECACMPGRSVDRFASRILIGVSGCSEAEALAHRMRVEDMLHAHCELAPRTEWRPVDESDRSGVGYKYEEMKRVWQKLSPEERDIVRYVSKNEDTRLSLSSIASGMRLRYIAGDNIDDVDIGRRMSDKTVKKHCQRLLGEFLILERRGLRGGVVLTEKGRRLADAVL